jgi:hypothetical protein
MSEYKLWNVYYLYYYAEGKGMWQRLCQVEANSESKAIEGATTIYGPPTIGKYKAERV